MDAIRARTGEVGHTIESAPLLWDALRLLADGVSLMIVYIDADQRYRFTNRAHDDWCGCPRGSLDGKHVREMFGEELYEAVRPHIETVLGGHSTTFEVTSPNRHGGTSVLHATYVPRFGDDGGVRGFLSVVLDVTGHKQAERVLRAIMEGTARATGDDFFPSLVRQLASVLEVRIAFVSECSGTSPAAARILALSVEDQLRGGFDYEVTGNPCEAVLAGASTLYPDRLRERFPDHRRLAEVGAESYLAVPFLDSAGRVIGHMGVIDDRPMTDGEGKMSILRVFAARVGAEVERLRTERVLREREEQLRQAQTMEAVGRFASGIAHDLRNILGVIHGFAELALSRVPAGTAVHGNVVEVLRASDRGKSFVHDLLVFGQPGEGERTIVRLGAAVDEVLGLVRASLPGNVTLRTRIGTAGGDILADPNQMRRLVLNLCSNAGHAMRERGGPLELAVDEVVGVHPKTVRELQPGNYVRLTVRDTGCGISPDVLPHIFEPFFSTRAPGDGSGLGLAVVDRLVTAHGGAIAVESEPGVGTTFEVLLPRAVAVAASPAGSVPAPRARGRILLVDDDEAYARMCAGTLEAIGYQVVVRHTGAEALETFAPAPGDFVAVVTDQAMPGMTGATLVTRLLAVRPDLPIVLQTGFGETIPAEVAKALGAREYVTRPSSPRELADALARATAADRGRGTS